MDEKIWEFIVRDRGGIWGELRCRALDEKDARMYCRQYLKKELEPQGSLQEPYRLISQKR